MKPMTLLMLGERLATVRHTVAAVVVTLALAASADAQVSTFDLSGTVLDPSAAVVPGASVTLKNTKTGLTRTETTDERGRYHFIALPVVGEYSVAVELSGFGSEERAGLIFQANSKPVINFLSPLPHSCTRYRSPNYNP